MESDGVDADRAAQNQAGNPGSPGLAGARAASRPPDKLPGGSVATVTWRCFPSTRALVGAEGTRGAGQPHGVGHWLCWSLSDCNPATQETQQVKASHRVTASPLTRSPRGLPGPRSAGVDGADEVLSRQCPRPGFSVTESASSGGSGAAGPWLSLRPAARQHQPLQGPHQRRNTQGRRQVKAQSSRLSKQITGELRDYYKYLRTGAGVTGPGALITFPQRHPKKKQNNEMLKI